MDIAVEDHSLYHYGILRKSGRYKWGSGETPHERAATFLGELAKERKEPGATDLLIAKSWGMTTSQLRETVTLANKTKKAADIAQANRLKEHGNSNVKIGKLMGINESSVRALLKDGEAEKAEILNVISDTLRRHVEKKKYIDVGIGVEYNLGVSKERLKTAVGILKDEGYTLHYIPVTQLGTGKKTSMKVLAAPGTTYSEVNKNRDQIQQIYGRSKDNGRSFDEILPPLSIDPKRVHVRYAEDGGTDADGTIYVRPGIKDVSLGGSNYAQVRIAVDGTHYLKGMALYNDEHMPPGVDLVFNTNKKNTGKKLDAMKPMKVDKATGKVDKEDPFGSMISEQIKETGTFGEQKVSSAMNIVNKESDWDEWSKTLSSQMLSKQKPRLAKDQLDLTYESKQREFDTIMALTNPTVKKHMLEKFAESADASAVHLKAAHLPRQATKVILPVNSLKPTEVYAPTFNDGERVVLIRFPHGHISEIPELVVNNRHPVAKKLLGNAPDAIGIHSAVAERLSGADFDGDTVLVIPNDHGKVKNKAPLEELRGFDPRSSYPKYEGMPVMDSRQKGIEMGKVSNLITDMTILGAHDAEIVRAVRHSMVVIDAEKHELNYTQSAKDNGILALQRKYQTKANGRVGGASTIVSRATSDIRVDARKFRSAKEGGPIDRATGKLVYVKTGEEYSDGKLKKIKSTKLAETDDAHTLVSKENVLIERIYADHSNRLKDLANQARKEMVATPDLVRSPSAAKVYTEQVKGLEAQLHLALENAPHERQAQVVANAVLRMKKEANPDMDEAELKKVRAKALKAARIRVGAKKTQIKITAKEWEAIQAGAISKTQLEKILDNTDIEKVKELATPKEKKGMSSADLSRAMSMLAGDKYSTADVARQLGVSVSTLNAALRGDGNE
jgi:hypothetical protein